MKNKKGFTLIELLAVIVILGIVVVIANIDTANKKLIMPTNITTK